MNLIGVTGIQGKVNVGDPVVIKSIAKKIISWVWGKLTYNTDINTWILIVAIVVGIYVWTNFWIQDTKEKTIGIIPTYDGFYIDTPEDSAKASELGLKQFILKDKQGNIKQIAMDAYRLPTDKEKNKFSMVASMDPRGMDVGVAYTPLDIYGFSLDAPIVQMRTIGVGISKKFTENMSGGIEMGIPWEAKDAEERKANTSFMLYGKLGL